jgi:hypothetical protein
LSCALEQLHGLAHEGGQIRRLPRSDEITVNHDFAVLVDSAGLTQLLGDRAVTSDPSSAQHSRTDQNLRAMANRGDQFAGSGRVPQWEITAT